MHQPINSTLPRPPLDAATLELFSFSGINILAIGGHLPVVLATFTVNAQKLLFPSLSCQNFDSAIRFNDPDFSQDSNSAKDNIFFWGGVFFSL